MTQPIFISGNANKVKYLSRVLGVELDHIKIDLDEIQSTDLRKIVEDKAHRAYDIIRKPVMVDDNGLFINALEACLDLLLSISSRVLASTKSVECWMDLTIGLHIRWDKIFISNMYSGRTNAELSNDEYDEYYKIVRSVTELRAFINIK